MLPHYFTLLLLAVAVQTFAQPLTEERSIVFVADAEGRPMAGAYATPVEAQAWLSKRNAPAWTVEMHFTVSKDYPYSRHEIGRHMSWPLTGDTVLDGRVRHLRFTILDGWCTDHYLLLIKGTDTMRITMPDRSIAFEQTAQHPERRNGKEAAPLVVRFQPGVYAFATFAEEDAYHPMEQRIAARLARDAQRRAHPEQRQRARVRLGASLPVRKDGL